MGITCARPYIYMEKNNKEQQDNKINIVPHGICLQTIREESRQATAKDMPFAFYEM